jgi:iron complex outermembrane receptor protein
MRATARYAYCLGIGLLIPGWGGTAILSAQLSPAGSYRSQTGTLELTADRRASWSGSSGAFSHGSYRVARDTLVLMGETGPAACPGQAGFYLWHLNADSLRLRLASDSCEARRSAMVTAWFRVAGVSGPIVQELDAVVTTAERQVKDVQHTPLAVAVIPAEDLRRAGVTRSQDLTYLVPGLQVGALGAASPMLYMRGVGNFAGNSLQDPTMTFNFDGVYIGRPAVTGGMFYDLERVEVLKGPQGTLYGRNATGGAINILPRLPVRNEFTGELAAEYGEHNTVRVDGWLNAPLGDRAAMRVAGQHLRHDAYLNDGTDDQADWAGRLTLLVDVSDRMTARVLADYSEQGGHGTGSTPLALGPANRWGVSSSEGGAFYQGQRVTIAGRNWEPIPSVQRVDNSHWGLSATLEGQTSLGALTLVSGYRRSRFDGITSSSGNLVASQEHSRQGSLEARLVSLPLRRLQTLVGTFLFDEVNETRDGELFRPWNQFNFSLQTPQSGVTSLAAFGRATWLATNRLRATLGLRYTHEKKPFRGVQESFSRICLPPASSCPNAQPFPVDLTTRPLEFPPDSIVVRSFNPADGTLTIGYRVVADEKETFARPTWRAALEYDLAESAFLYGSYETGFKSGGFFFSSDAKVYRPERLGAFTLGLKSRLFANRLQANVELYDWRYRDQQVSKISIDSRGVPNLRTENIGRATIRGAEADVTHLLLPTTRLSANVQFLHATYDSYTYLTPLSSGPPVSGCSVAQTAEGFQVDCSGNRSPYAPEWTLALGAEQTVSLPGGARLISLARARYQSEAMMGLDFLSLQQQDGYWMVDAAITLRTARGPHSVGVFGQNLTNRTVISNTFVVPFSTFPIGVLRPPRTLGIRVSTGFATTSL